MKMYTRMICTNCAFRTYVVRDPQSCLFDYIHVPHKSVTICSERSSYALPHEQTQKHELVMTLRYSFSTITGITADNENYIIGFQVFGGL